MLDDTVDYGDGVSSLQKDESGYKLVEFRPETFHI